MRYEILKTMQSDDGSYTILFEKIKTEETEEILEVWKGSFPSPWSKTRELVIMDSDLKHLTYQSTNVLPGFDEFLKKERTAIIVQGYELMAMKDVHKFMVEKTTEKWVLG
jgi:hypothetical protein